MRSKRATNGSILEPFPIGQQLTSLPPPSRFPLLCFPNLDCRLSSSFTHCIDNTLTCLAKLLLACLTDSTHLPPGNVRPGLTQFLRAQCASCSLSEESCNQIQSTLMPCYRSGALSDCRAAWTTKAGTSLSQYYLGSLNSLFRPQSDDDVKRGTIVIRLWRSYARDALLGAACFRRRENFLQRLID